MKRNKGRLIILSGPSGTGKSTVISRLVKLRDDIRFSVSATTRLPRAGETNGKDYFFISRQTFSEMIGRKAFLEHAEFAGNCYGTPAGPVDENLAAGYNVLLDIEVQGAMQVMAARPEAVSIFLCPPGFEVLERRLRGRGTDAEDKIRKRLETARWELSQRHRYTYIVVNDDADDAAAKLDAIITAESCRGINNTHFTIEGEY